MIKNTELIFKALSEKSRLQIVSVLLEKDSYIEELAQILDLSEPNISFHLKKLEEAELIISKKDQYYNIYSLKKEFLDITLRDLIYTEDIQKKVQEDRLEKYRQKVINSFIENGKLKIIPVQRKKKRIILEEIAKKFQKNQDYTEREVNFIIAGFNDDFCTIRRDMISEKIFIRENGIYRLS